MYTTLRSKLFYGRYITKKKQIVSFIDYFKFKNIKIIDKDATKLLPGFFTSKFCLAYFDMDLYLPTIKALKAMDGNIVKGGYIVFDDYEDVWSSTEVCYAVDYLVANKMKDGFEIVGSLPNIQNARPAIMLNSNLFVVKKL